MKPFPPAPRVPARVILPILTVAASVLAPSVRAEGQSFVRGAVNQDASLDISDPVALLLYLFIGGDPPACADAADSDDDGRLLLNDAILTLDHLFRGGAPLAAPRSCGADPTDDALGCEQFAPCAAPPSIEGVTAPTSLRRGEIGELVLEALDPDGDLALLEIVETTAIAENRGQLPIAFLGLAGGGGVVRVPIDASRLPFGEVRYELTLRDVAENASTPRTFSVDIRGREDGGTPPAIADFAVLEPTWTRPSGAHERARPTFVFAWSDPDGDIADYRVELTLPNDARRVSEGRAAALDPSVAEGGTAGEAAASLLTFGSDDPLGLYGVALTLFDENGNVGNTLQASVELVDEGGQMSPGIEAFDPPQAAHGTEVVIFGSGFSAGDPGAHEVTLGDVLLEVVATTESTLTVVLPQDASSGFVRVMTAAGEATADEILVVAPAVRLYPLDAAVRVGATLAFEVGFNSVAHREIVWLVDGIEGGDATVGEIDTEGVYSAPSSIPPAGGVTVSVRLASDATIHDEQHVDILAPVATPGRALVLASSGATLTSDDGSAAIEIPPGALRSDEEISIEVLRGGDAAPHRPDLRVISTVRLGPSGLVFAEPAVATMPLSRYVAPGTRLPLLYWDPATGDFTDGGVEAEVVSNGEAARAPIAHFSTLVVGFPLASASVVPLALTITRLDVAPFAPSFAEFADIAPAVPSGAILEGMSVPVQITGDGLHLDLEVFVIGPDGDTNRDVIPDALRTAVDPDGPDRAGLVLHVQPIRDLPRGARRTYTLRLRRWSNPFDPTSLPPFFADATFEVVGLDELIVPADRDLTVDGPLRRLVSTLEVPPGRELRVRNGDLEVLATGPVTIHGRINVDGERGRNAAGQFGGPGQLACFVDRLEPEVCPWLGGHGGRGREDEGCFLSIFDDGYDCAEPENWGGYGVNCVTSNRAATHYFRFCHPGSDLPRGVPGLPGRNFSFDPLELATTLLGCINSEPLSCVSFGRNVVGGVVNVVNLAEGRLVGGGGFGAGTRGAATQVQAAGPGTGGGGGGGGRIRVSVLGSGVEIYGGGGGAGGRAGNDARIVSAGRIDFGSAGVLSCRGGNGGNGSSEGRLWVGVFGIGGVVASNVPALPGGAGGGGTSGVYDLEAARGISTNSLVGHVLNDGGEPGDGARAVIAPVDSDYFLVNGHDPGNEHGRGLDTGALSRAADPFVYSGGVVIDTRTLDTSVRGRGALPVRVRSSKSSLPSGLRVRAASGGTVTVPLARIGPSEHAADIDLAEGFHEVTADPDTTRAAPVYRVKYVLVLPADRDGDGLPDAIELARGTDPDRADSDGDGLDDAYEVVNGTDPRVADGDGDGVNDLEEVAAGTNPFSLDTDEDAVLDGVEIFLGSSPTLAGSTPASLPEGTLLGAQDGFLTLIDVEAGRSYPVGRPNGGADFGLTSDGPQILVSRGEELAAIDAGDLRVGPDLGLTVTSIGPLTIGASAVRVLEMSRDPASGRILGVELGPGPFFAPTGQLVEIDPATGVATRLAETLDTPIRALSFDATGSLYAALDELASDRLTSLDALSGALVRDIGDLGIDDVFGLAFDCEGGLRAMSSGSPNRTLVHLVSLDTGATTPLGELASAIQSLAATPCGGGASGPFTIIALQGAFSGFGFPSLDDLGRVAFWGAIGDCRVEFCVDALAVGDGTRAPEVVYRADELPFDVALSRQPILGAGGHLVWAAEGGAIYAGHIDRRTPLRIIEDPPGAFCPYDFSLHDADYRPNFSLPFGLGGAPTDDLPGNIVVEGFRCPERTSPVVVLHDGSAPRIVGDRAAGSIERFPFLAVAMAPDGSRLAYVEQAFRQDTQEARVLVWVAEAPDWTPRLALEAPDDPATASPPAHMLAAVSTSIGTVDINSRGVIALAGYRADPNGPGGISVEGEIWTVETDGRTVFDAPRFVAAGAAGRGGLYTLAINDSGKIAFWRSAGGQLAAIAEVDLESGEERDIFAARQTLDDGSELELIFWAGPNAYNASGELALRVAIYGVDGIIRVNR